MTIFIVYDNNGVRLANAETYALLLLQDSMSDTAGKAVIKSEKHVVPMIS